MNWFDEIFLCWRREREFLVFPHCVSHFFCKNFVKVMFLLQLLQKLLKRWFHEILFSQREFLVFPHCSLWSDLARRLRDESHCKWLLVLFSKLLTASTFLFALFAIPRTRLCHHIPSMFWVSSSWTRAQIIFVARFLQTAHNFSLGFDILRTLMITLSMFILIFHAWFRLKSKLLYPLFF